jgi:hypothetical protein
MDVTERKVIAVEAIVVAAVVATALLLQLLVGSFPIEIFVLPLNATILALWVFVVYMLHTNREKSIVAKLADDIIVGVRGKNVEIVVKKSFGIL